MRLWRKLTLPIIRQFPILTELYDETCLIPNPFFRVANLDCSPCADVINVVDLTMVSHIDYLGNNIPHIIKQVIISPFHCYFYIIIQHFSVFQRKQVFINTFLTFQQIYLNRTTM